MLFIIIQLKFLKEEVFICLIVYLLNSKKKKDQRPKVIVYENDKNSRRKLLELKLVMVAEQ